MKGINTDRLLVVDLYSGEYARKHIGHEDLNFTRNLLDNNYYGYCPPWDGVTISNFGAKSTDDYIDGITVVYVRKINGSNDREIIGFCINARVFKHGQTEEELNRYIKKDDEIRSASYSILSDNLFDLRSQSNKFEIKIRNYNSYMFRKQRFYGGTYPDLDAKIIFYLNSYLESKILLDDDGIEEQEAIQISEPATKNEIKSSINTEPLKIVGNQGVVIQRNNRISKAALVLAEYTCAIDSSHRTFFTKQKALYMEGHHLIPCTVQNSEYFWNKFQRNIDCLENIVSLCPNCHRAIHYGDWDSKSKLIEALFEKQKDKLHSVGIMITLNELLDLYRN